MEIRKVSLSTFFRLFKTKKPIAIIGVVFTLLSLFFVLPMIIIISSGIKEKYETYDHETITNNGVRKTAIVLGVTTLQNITVNGVNPIVIEYEYDNNGTPVNDKLQTLEIEKVEKLSAGNNVIVKVLDNESVIEGIEPFSFPFEMFYLLPLVFLLVGVPLLLTALLPALRDFKLYKSGIIQEGQVEYMTQYDGLPISGIGKKTIVGYSYISHGIKVFGESSTTDSMVLYEKKRGDSIKIFVSDDGKRSCLVSKIEAIKNGWNIDIA